MSKEIKHVKKFRENHLQNGETIIAWSDGYIGEMMGKGNNAQRNGALIITETRAVFYRKGLLGEVLETIPLKSITSIERKSTLGHKTIRLHASHDDLAFKSMGMDKDTQTKLIEAIEAGRQLSPASSNVVISEESPIEKLKKLGELKEAGVITESEFENKKAELLASV